ncbi:MAG: DNA repair protein RecN, partial [Verrucomicrobia bacterium]|nr:DNA repair protein RecN [Verrucomicrobiota bacterium]
GYNVISGETGAGKSVIIGALKLVLGERADRTLIRAGCDACTVEVVFDVRQVRAPLAAFLEDNGIEPCDDHQLVIKRTFTASGSNRQFINGSPTTLAALASIGDWLVDMHGPHDHQSLLHPARQLDILDAHGGLEAEREGFAELARRRSQSLARKASLIVDEKTYAQQLELLAFQVKEIMGAQLQPDEDMEVEKEHARAANAARLLELGHAVIDQIVENENSLLTQAGQITRKLQELSGLDSATAPLLEQQQQIMESFRELASGLSGYLDRVDVDPDRLKTLEERLNLLQSLKRKYGPDLAGVIAFGQDARARLTALEQREEELARIQSELAELEGSLRKLGRSLSSKRRKVIPKLCQEATRQLRDLGFKASQMDIAMATRLPPPDQAFDLPKESGFDTVEFQFAPNPGEPPRPLRAIASSGELARVMLALKTVLAEEDRIPLLVFDEVDANIGGETAHAVGQKMKQIAARRQVICITHLPQVAAPATSHYVVTKQTTGGRTLSGIHLVTGDERVQELSRMLGGTTEAAVRHAREMLVAGDRG